MTTVLRRIVATVTVAVVAAGSLIAVSAPVQASFTSTLDGSITRAEIIERAQYWVDHQPGPYDQGGYSPGPTGDHNYRRDCSGFVSMAWHTNTNYATGTLGSVTYEIQRSQLQAGDIMLDAGDHVFLFEAWKADHVHFSYYTFGSTPVRRYDNVSINAPSLDGHPNGDYVARRYNKIIDGPASPFTTPSSGIRADYQGDGYDDLASFYDNGNASSSLWLWSGRASAGFAAPIQVWQSLPGGWDTQRAQPLGGDFNGDGRDDVAAFYDNGNATSSLWFWLSQSSGGFAAPVEVWHSALGGWNLPNAKPVVGDFTDDGSADIAAFYDLGNGTSSLVLWSGDAAGPGFAVPSDRWQSVANGWNLSRAKPVAGDFDGDGDAEIGSFYDLGSATASFWIWPTDATGPLPSPAQSWQTAAGGWDLNRAKPLVGDFNADGRDDIGSYYDAGNAASSLWTWYAQAAGGFSGATQVWASAAGGWNLAKARPVAGDFNGDGRDDIGSYYDLGNAATLLVTWPATAAGTFAPGNVWQSAAGGWDLNKARPV